MEQSASRSTLRAGKAVRGVVLSVDAGLGRRGSATTCGWRHIVRETYGAGHRARVLVAPGATNVDGEPAPSRWVAADDTHVDGARSQARLVARRATPHRGTAGHANVPKEQASDSGDRSHRYRPDLGGRSLRCRCTGTHDRNHVIRCRLPLRDDLSIDPGPDETQYHLSPNIGDRGGVIHRPSTTPHEGASSDV